jgi:tRNA A-37 threonylcarbamoyl transferase component Bud32
MSVLLAIARHGSRGSLRRLITADIFPRKSLISFAYSIHLNEEKKMSARKANPQKSPAPKASRSVAGAGKTAAASAADGKRKLLSERSSKQVWRVGERVEKIFTAPYAAPDVLNEAANLACANETPLKTPRFYAVFSRSGHWVLEMENISGETLADKMAREPRKLAAYLERFVALQLEMHACGAARLPLLADKMHRKISACGLDATTRYELHTRLDSLPRHAKLCHGDFIPSNVIITANDDAYVLDWAHATQGNGSADAARTYLLFALEGKMALAEQYLNLYCARSDTAKQYVQKWMAIVAASRMVKGKPEEREFLSRWANVVEYQ